MRKKPAYNRRLFFGVLSVVRIRSCLEQGVKLRRILIEQIRF